MMNVNAEMIEKAKAARSAEELLDLAKAEGIDMTEDEAEKYFEQISSLTLDDELLDMVSGGAIVSEPLMKHDLDAEKDEKRKKSHCG